MSTGTGLVRTVIEPPSITVLLKRLFWFGDWGSHHSKCRSAILKTAPRRVLAIVKTTDGFGEQPPRLIPQPCDAAPSGRRVAIMSSCPINSLIESPSTSSRCFVRTASVVIHAIISRGITPYGRPILLGASMVRVKGAVTALKLIALGLTVRERRLHQRARHVTQSAGLFGVLRLDRQRISNQPVEAGTIHGFTDFFISVFTTQRD